MFSNDNFPNFLHLTPLNLPNVETSDARSDDNQRATPLGGEGGGHINNGTE